MTSPTQLGAASMVTLCEQTAAFSEQLLVWARGLQADCARLKREVGDDSSIDDYSDGRELVRSMEAGVENLGATVRQIRDETFSDGTLASAVAVALQFQSDSEAQLERVVQHLQQQHRYALAEHEPTDASAAEAAVADDNADQAVAPARLAAQEEVDAQEAETCFDGEMDPLAAADAMMTEDSPTPSLGSFQPESPDCTPRDPDMPRTPRLEDFGLGDLAKKYGLAMDNEGEDAGENAQVEQLGSSTSTRPRTEASPSKPAASDLPQTTTGFTPRQSPRLAAKRQQSPMEKVFARASSPSPLKVMNRTDSHGLTDLKARLSAATRARVTVAE